jgi:hypothetical protein
MDIHGLTRLIMAWTWRKPSPSSLWYYLWLAMGVHFNVTFFNTPKSGVLKFSKLGLSPLWKPITFCEDLWLRWSMKQSCIPRRDLFNNIWHAAWTHIIQGDSWLLMVENQIDILIPDLFFNHNLYCKYSMDHARLFKTSMY